MIVTPADWLNRGVVSFHRMLPTFKDNTCDTLLCGGATFKPFLVNLCPGADKEDCPETAIA